MRLIHDKVTIFARFTNTQKVSKPEVVGSKPLCSKWMSRGDGVEIGSAISSTALSLHNLHSCKIWRYFIQFNYHSGSAREAISVSSPNASQTLPSMTTRSPAVPAILSENHIHENSAKLPMVHSSLYATFIISIKSHLLLFNSGFFFYFEKCIFSVTKLRHIVSSFHTFHVCFAPAFTSSSL